MKFNLFDIVSRATAQEEFERRNSASGFGGDLFSSEPADYPPNQDEIAAEEAYRQRMLAAWRARKGL